ncbi:MAG: hypothetical protein J6P66_02730 [Bacteroidaceae bacterium]|nr:hypothetical protein [Bacteroidaceae bacterium]
MMISPQARCQDASFNYIATERMLDSQGTGAKSVQYYDGYGRPDLLATGGQKLWTVHRTPTGFIPANILLDPDKPKPTPEIGNTPSQYSQLGSLL